MGSGCEIHSAFRGLPENQKAMGRGASENADTVLIQAPRRSGIRRNQPPVPHHERLEVGDVVPVHCRRPGCGNVLRIGSVPITAVVTQRGVRPPGDPRWGGGGHLCQECVRKSLSAGGSPSVFTAPRGAEGTKAPPAAQGAAPSVASAPKTSTLRIPERATVPFDEQDTWEVVVGPGSPGPQAALGRRAKRWAEVRIAPDGTVRVFDKMARRGGEEETTVYEGHHLGEALDAAKTVERTAYRDPRVRLHSGKSWQHGPGYFRDESYEDFKRQVGLILESVDRPLAEATNRIDARLSGASPLTLDEARAQVAVVTSERLADLGVAD